MATDLPGPPGNLGDGDLVDPEIAGIDDAELADVPTVSHDVVDASVAGGVGIACSWPCVAARAIVLIPSLCHHVDA